LAKGSISQAAASPSNRFQGKATAKQSISPKTKHLTQNKASHQKQSTHAKQSSHQKQSIHAKQSSHQKQSISPKTKRPPQGTQAA
jgi:spore coat protein B